MARFGLHLATTLSILLVGAGCGGGDDDEGNANEEPSSTTEPASEEPTEPTTEEPTEPASEEPTGPAFGEKIDIGVAVTMTVQEPQLGDGARLDVLVTVKDDFQLEGGPEADIDLFLACAGNYKSGRTFIDAKTPNPVLDTGKLKSGGKVEGFVSLELPMYEGAVVEACEPGRVQLVVPGFAGQNTIYTLDEKLAQSILDQI